MNMLTGVSLQKGGNVDLRKLDPSLTKLNIGLGWSVRATDGAPFDLDATAFMLNAAGKVRQDKDFIFYGNLRAPDGSVAHMGDNRTGEGDGDDETIQIDLSKVPADIEKIAICVTIYDADARRQTFGQVSQAQIRCVNAESNTQLAVYDLSEDASVETALIFGEVYRNNGSWKFRAVGQGFAGGLAPLARNYGVNVA